MLKSGLIIGASAIGLLVQDPRTARPRQAEKPAVQKRQLPFPKGEARWVIHGKVKADTMLQPRSFAVQANLRGPLGKTVEDPSRLCNARDLTLPNVHVAVSRVGDMPIEALWSFEVPDDPVLLEHVRCRFVPHVIGLMTGQELQITNSDSILHNVRWRGRRNPRFNFVQGKGDKTSTWFTKAETAAIRCDIHGWTRCLVHILPHPVFAVSNEHGRFSLPPLPDGKYELVAAHELLGKITKKVEIEGKPRKWLKLVFKVPEMLRATK